MFLEKVYSGRNQWYFYIFSLLIIFTATQIGSLPLVGYMIMEDPSILQGVDIEAGYKSVELMKEHVKKTMRPEVLGGLGGFAGAFDLSGIKNMEEPVLLSGTDGCGTKVKLAFVMDKHDTIGIDAVAMCVNDIACSGGEPLFFLDYIACGKTF